MFSLHSVLIAAIFSAYILLMGALFVHILHTGQPQSPPGSDPDETEREPRAGRDETGRVSARIPACR